MKSLSKTVVMSVIAAILAPAMLVAQNSPAAQVLSEDPDGAIVVRAGSSMAVDAGDVLQDGDVIKTYGSTLIVSICDGALITVYPGTELVVSGLGTSMANLTLRSGEILGDSMAGCGISVSNVVGTANISNGVYGVVLSPSGDGWTLQVRNLDGTVTFTGADSLDSSSMAISLVEAGKTIDVPVGEEVIIRGVYDSGMDIFALSTGGAAMAMISDETVGDMRNDAIEMSAIASTGPSTEPMAPPEETPQAGPPSEDELQQIVVEVPWEEVETASSKG